MVIAISPVHGRGTSADKEYDMRNAMKRAEGAAEELTGKAKNAVGKLINNKSMQVSGKAREVQGKLRQQAAKLTASVSPAADRSTGGRQRVSSGLGGSRKQSARSASDSRRSASR
jgi:uncharacterized protein YjbJ (UPF0337 family)